VPDRVDPDVLTRATDFVVALARLIDRDEGRRASGSAQPAPERV
jgi:hypothetical protein